MKKKKIQTGKKPAAPAAAIEETAASVSPVEQPAAPAAEKPAVKEAAPVAVEPAAVEASKPAPEKKPARKVQKPKAKTAEKAPKSARKPKAEKEEKPAASPLRRTKVDIPAALGLYVQYQGGEVDMAAVAETAKAEFKAANKRGRIASLKIYLKPEEHTAYYVINDDFQGQVAL